jgi:hypothetical protein
VLYTFVEPSARYRALDTERGDFVAVKEIEKRLLAPEQLPKIMQEAELLKVRVFEGEVCVCYPFCLTLFGL